MFSNIKITSRHVSIAIAFVFAVLALLLTAQNLKADTGWYKCEKVWGCPSYNEDGTKKYTVIPQGTNLNITATKLQTITIKTWWGRTTTKEVTLGQSTYGVAGSWYNLTDDFK